MSGPNTFPWDSLKAETLRSIVQDLGLPAARSLRKREGMVNVLTAVAENGLEKTIEEYREIANKEQAERSKANEARHESPKRKRRNTFEGIVLPSRSKRTRRPSAKARSAQ